MRAKVVNFLGPAREVFAGPSNIFAVFLPSFNIPPELAILFGAYSPEWRREK
jgi:hypothetical protein